MARALDGGSAPSLERPFRPVREGVSMDELFAAGTAHEKREVLWLASAEITAYRDADEWLFCKQGSATFTTQSAIGSWTTPAEGDTMFAATKPYMQMQPGVTTMGAVTYGYHSRLTDITLRLGFFSPLPSAGSGTPNGIGWLEIAMAGSSGYAFAVRDGNTYAQSLWNLDRMDGTGPSGANLSQLATGDSVTFVVRATNQFMGRITYGILWRKRLVWVHETQYRDFNSARLNVAPAAKQYVALSTSCATSGFSYIGSAVVWTESPPKPTYQTSVSSPLGAATNSGTGGTLVPILSLAASYRNVLVAPTAVSICNTGNAAVTVRLVQDATLTGPSWTAVPYTTPFARGITYDTTATAMSGGRAFMTVMVAPASAVTVPIKLRRPMCYPLTSIVLAGSSPSFTYETMTVAATTAGGVAQGVIVSLDYDEYGASV
jgi:hypothetical protein